MNIILTQTHSFASEALYQPLWAVWSTFMMEKFTFLSFNLLVAIHCHYKSRKRRGVY